MNKTNNKIEEKDELTKRLDEACIKAGLKPNWNYDKAGQSVVIVPTGIKIKQTKGGSHEV